MSPIKILILTANPQNTDRLQLEREIRDIKAALQRSKLRDHFQIITEGAVRVTDLIDALLQHEPTVVHFSVHGGGEQGLALENDNSQMQLVPNDALVELFRQHKSTIKCVFLNACYSEVQGDAIHQHIDCVVGMKKAIGDMTAIQFSPKFYGALGQGCSFQTAFDSAKVFLQSGSNPEVSTPILKIRQGAANLFSDKPTTQEAAMPSQPTSQGNLTVGNITIEGNDNPFNLVKGDHNEISNEISQHINQPTKATSGLEAALTGLCKLKRAITNTNALASFQKSRAQGDVELIEKHLREPNCDKSVVDEAIAALKKDLEGAATLTEHVEQVAELLEKIGMM